MTAPTTSRTEGRVPPWGAPAAVGATAVGLAAAVAAIAPSTRAGLAPGCPFRLLTGLDCPGCGATRSLYALTQGDVVLALDHNAMFVALLPLLVGAWAIWLVRRVRSGHGAAAPVPSAGVGLGIAITWLVFTVVRNLPWEPFSWLGSLPSG